MMDPSAILRTNDRSSHRDRRAPEVRYAETAVSADAPAFMRSNQHVQNTGAYAASSAPTGWGADTGREAGELMSPRGTVPSMATRMEAINGRDELHRQPNTRGQFELSMGGERRHYTESDGRGRALNGDWRVQPPDQTRIREQAQEFDAGYKLGWTGGMADSFAVGLVNDRTAHTVSSAFANKKADMPALHPSVVTYDQGSFQKEMFNFESGLRDTIMTPRHVPKPLPKEVLTPSQVRAESLAERHQTLAHQRNHSVALHLDERHVRANGLLLQQPGLLAKLQRANMDVPPSVAPKLTQPAERPASKAVWQPRSLHLGRTHKQSDSTLRTFSGHSMEVLEVTVYRDFLFTASKDRTIKMWDLVTSECLNTFKGHTDWITDLKTCSKERKLLPSTRTGRPLVLLSASVDKTARLWDALTGECFSVLSGGHEEAITTIDWVYKYAFTGSSDGTIAKWHLDSESVVDRCVGHRGTIWNITCESNFVFSASDDLTARQWDQKTCAQVRVFRGHTGSVLDLCCVLSGGKEGFENAGILCTVSEDGSLRLWRTGPDEEEGGKCVGLARGFDAAMQLGEHHDNPDCRYQARPITVAARGSTCTQQDVMAPGSARAARLAAEKEPTCKFSKKEHYANVSGWQWMGALHSVCCDNDTGVIYTGSSSGVICEFDLNQRSWEELEDSHDIDGSGVMELVRNHYYFSNSKRFGNRANGEKYQKGSTIYTLHLADDGYLFAGSEDGTAHEFWVNRAGREHELIEGNCKTTGGRAIC